VGDAAVSVTVTVQVAGVLAGVAVGQLTVVAVVRATTSIVSLSLLVACTEAAAGSYVPSIV
jgi:hypothetical protein